MSHRDSTAMHPVEIETLEFTTAVNNLIKEMLICSSERSAINPVSTSAACECLKSLPPLNDLATTHKIIVEFFNTHILGSALVFILETQTSKLRFLEDQAFRSPELSEYALKELVEEVFSPVPHGIMSAIQQLQERKTKLSQKVLDGEINLKVVARDLDAMIREDEDSKGEDQDEDGIYIFTPEQQEKIVKKVSLNQLAFPRDEEDAIERRLRRIDRKQRAKTAQDADNAAEVEAEDSGSSSGEEEVCDEPMENVLSPEQMSKMRDKVPLRELFPLEEALAIEEKLDKLEWKPRPKEDKDAKDSTGKESKGNSQ